MAFAIVSACGGSAERTSRPRTPAHPEIGPLADLVPRGAELVVIARPDDALSRPAIATIVSLVLPEPRQRSLRDRYGVDVRALTELAWCTHGDATLILARGPIDAHRVIRRAERRMSALEGSRSAPFPRRTGLLDGQRHDFVALDRNTLALLRGEPGMMDAVLRAVRARERSGALSPRPLRELAARHGGAPVVVYAPRPIRLPTDTGIGLLLSRERALAVALDGDGSEIVARIELVGEFPPTAAENFAALVRSLGESDLGRALGLQDSASRAEIEVDQPEGADVAVGVRIGLRADAEEIGRGVREVFVAELADLFGERSPSAP
ncbi:MAG: hypothetical protein IT379_32310 [Deltaproteobacteria bacterium]|nr:hypothetical protein [Deltaproteobacteria bacterium]